MNNKYQFNLIKINIYAFLCGCRFSLPILFIDFKERGFSYSQIGIFFSIQAISGLVSEIPAGTFADRFGSKYSLAVSSMGIGISYFLMSTTNDFFTMSLIFIIWGVAKAFHSGADTAFIIDSLNHLKLKHKSSKYLGQKWSSFYFGLAISSLLSPFIIKHFSLTWTYYGTTITAFIATFFIITTHRIEIDHSNEGSIKHVKTLRQYINYLKDGYVFLKGHPIIKYLVILSVIFMLGPQVFFQYTQKIMESIQIDKEDFGYYYAAFTGTAAFASIISHRIDGLIGQKRMIYLLASICVISLCTQSVTYASMWGLVTIFLVQFLTGFSTSIMNHYLNEHIDSHNRATLNSFKTFLFGVLMFILSPCIGYLADNISVPNSLVIFGCILLVFCIGPVFKISARVKRV